MLDPLPALVVVAAVLSVSTLLGLVWRHRTGRLRDARAVRVAPDDFGPGIDFGDRATLVQFSTETCAFCPSTRALLSELATSTVGVKHVEIDVTDRVDIADRFNIMQTPTTLLLDGRGVVAGRIGGAPRRAEITTAVHELVEGRNVSAA